MSTLLERFLAAPAPGGGSPQDRLALCRGTPADYAALAEHHYLARRPATITRVLTLLDPAPGVAERFSAGRRLQGPGPGGDEGRGAIHKFAHVAPAAAPPGPWALRPGPYSRVAAVLLESLPALGCVLRDHATGGRYRLRDRRASADLLNAEVRCISRVIVHPQWRGLGLAVRLVREALRTATTPYTEALAAMGQVHPFFEQAGMTAYRRPSHARDARLAAALEAAGIALTDLARLDALTARLAALPADRGRFVQRELARWGRRFDGRGDDAGLRAVLEAARRRLLGEPVYYLHANPVAGSG